MELHNHWLGLMKTVVTATGSGRARSNFASQHLSAAIYFAARMRILEQESPPSKERFAPEGYSHYWYSTVAFAAMAVEANIYELMKSGERGEAPLAPRLFRNEDFRRPILDRYDLLYRTMLHNTPMPTDQGVNQDIKGLISLRDQIVHYKSEFRDEPTVSDKLLKLVGRKFGRNPYKCGDVFFPEQCISVAAAEWVITTARRFIIGFADATGLRKTVA